MILGKVDYYNLYLGGEYVVAAGDRYLHPVTPNETAESINLRLKKAAYPNFQRKIVNIFLDYVFFGGLKYEGQPPYDIDFIAREWLKNALIAGGAYIVVLNGEPYVFREIDYSKDDVGRVHFGTDKQDIIFENDGEAVLIIDKETGAQTETTGFWIFDTWSGDGMSLIADTANINVQIYNLQSTLDTLSSNAGLYITTGANMGNVNKLKPFHHYPVASGEPPVTFQAPPTSQLTTIRDEISKRIGVMAAIVGLTQEFSEEINIESGEAKKWRMLDTNAAVLSMANATARIINELNTRLNEFYGQPIITVQLNPILSPMADSEKIKIFDNIINTVRIDEIVKAAQKEKIKLAFSHLSENQKDELLNLIEKNGGLEAVENFGQNLLM